MGLNDDMIDEDRKIEDELYDYRPEEREQVLKDFHGRNKDEFIGVDFGEKGNTYNNSGGMSGSNNSGELFASIIGFIAVVVFLFLFIFVLYVIEKLFL